MRGQVDPQSGLFSYFSVEERIPADHPLRRVKAQTDPVLASTSAEIDAMYASVGRPSIAPERLLKASLLIALYSVRSDRLFCEMLDYNMLFRWFLDMNLEERSFDCQGDPRFPQVWEPKIPHPVHASASSARTRPAFNFSFSRYELPRMLSVTA